MSFSFMVPLFVSSTHVYVLSFGNVTFGGFGRLSFHFGFDLSIFCSAMNLSISAIAGSLLFAGAAGVVTGFFSSEKAGVANATASAQAVSERRGRFVMGP